MYSRSPCPKLPPKSTSGPLPCSLPSPQPASHPVQYALVNHRASTVAFKIQTSIAQCSQELNLIAVIMKMIQEHNDDRSLSRRAPLLPGLRTARPAFLTLTMVDLSTAAVGRCQLSIGQYCTNTCFTLITSKMSSFRNSTKKHAE